MQHSETVEARSHSDILEEILKGGHIKPVYQPIVFLSNGQVYGYEALSRISKQELQMNIEQMFQLADKNGNAWELEKLCRARALENAAQLSADKKLFLNVNSNILYDNQFRTGFTREHLQEYGVDASNIIFEITERVAALDSSAFLCSIDHYKKQSYGIAIDDAGAGYSGLNNIASVKPNLIKLDMSLVRDIDKDEIKRLLCKAMVDFGRSAGIQLIAEGIETEEELAVLVRLGVDLGQGYFLGLPQESLSPIAAEKVETIKRCHAKQYNENFTNSVYPIVGYLAKPGYIVSPDEKLGSIYETLKQNLSVTEFSVVRDDLTMGFMTRTDLNELLGGRYGYGLHSKKTVQQAMKPDFSRVNYGMTVDAVSRLAMQRPLEQLYNPIVVEKDGKYLGIVTIKNLLDACTKVEVDIARHSNPLTGLPGNLAIEKEILSRIFTDAPYCVTYYDIDNFKAYNDAYGFENGDKMLTLLAEILKTCAVRKEFIGHIGGDDFIVICDYHEGERYCGAVVERFSREVKSLYREQDIRNGYIISKNRNGVTESFPIAGLSVAGISNRVRKYENIGDFSQDIAQLKKKCKKQPGNYIEIL